MASPPSKLAQAAWPLRTQCVLRRATVFPPFKLSQADLLLRIGCILRRATVIPPFKLSQADLLLRIQCVLGRTTVFPPSKLSQAALLISIEPFVGRTNHYIEHRRKVLALLVHRTDRLNSEEMSSSCENLRFVDPAHRSHFLSNSVTNPCTAAMVPEAKCESTWRRRGSTID
jgi:hypothetical protein